VVVDVQLLVVPDCPNEPETRELLRRALGETGTGDSPIRIVVVSTAEQARELGFAGSPTILLDGADPFPPAEHATGLACRMYAQPGGPQGAPELAALVAAIRGHKAAEPNAAEAAHRPVSVPRGSAAAQTATDIAAGSR
jgi:hypothetical protein